MLTLSKSLRRAVRTVACAMAIGAASVAATAQTDPPTSASLNAISGPYSVSSSSVFLPRGFGGGTVYYPTAPGRYGAIAISPGFTGTSSSISWLARRLASHGFVTIAMDTLTILDLPDSRATQLRAALNYLVGSSGSAVQSRVDPNRLAVAGHSMGGGGSLIAAQSVPSLKAAYPLTPWNLTSFFSGVRVPTLIIGADADTIAPVASHARPFYAALPSSTSKAYGELNNASHFSPNMTNTPIGRYGVAWMKRFVDSDTRYSPFLCGAEHDRYATRSVFDRYQENCPY